MRAIGGLSDIADRYDGFILDQFGVLHDGRTLYPGTLDALAALKKRGARAVIVSNSPWLSAQSTASLAHRYGLVRDLYDRMITAGDMAVIAMRDHAAGKRAWLLGDSSFSMLLDAAGARGGATPHNCDFILNCIPGSDADDHAALAKDLRIAQARNIPMICANPDMTVRIGPDTLLCAGSLAHDYEQMGGTVYYCGKPHPEIYAEAFKILGAIPRARIAAVGDSLHTDIQGARRAGIAGIMTLCGIHWEELCPAHTPEEPDLSLLASLLEESPHKPDFYMREFAW